MKKRKSIQGIKTHEHFDFCCNNCGRDESLSQRHAMARSFLHKLKTSKKTLTVDDLFDKKFRPAISGCCVLVKISFEIL